MYFTGFADEAARDLAGQIAATKELGWSNIECRAIDGVNVHDLSDEAFDRAAAALDEAGVHVNCFGSAIANWGKSIDSDADLEKDLEQTKRAIVRMKRLGTEFVRIMSWKVFPDRPPEDQMREKRWEWLRRIAGMFLDAGLQPLHENCMNYAGRGWSYTLDMLDNVPGLKLVFDTGNPVMLPDWTKPEPWPMQSSWEFYRAVRDHVAYVHVKDGVFSDGKMNYAYAGEGSGDVAKIFADLAARGYDGGISIEPHLAAIFHDPKTGLPDPVKMHDTYVEDGRRTMKLWEAAKAACEAPTA